MIWILIVAALGIVLVAVGTQLTKTQTSGPARSEVSLPYRKTRSVFSPAERQFYEVLRRVVGDRYVIFAKMRMSDLLWIDAKGKDRMSAFGRVSQKHADFVLLTPDTLTPALVIELDDSSHQRQDRHDRDQLVDAIYQKAGLPIWHVPVAQNWRPEEVAKGLNRALAAQ